MSSPRKKKVLIVEDNRDAAETLATLIELKGHKAFVAYDAESGLELAHEAVPDLIVHDVNLPGMSGYQAIRYLRADPNLEATEFVALTGFATTADREHALSAGFDYHIGKPMDF